MDYVIILTMCASKKEARDIAGALLARRLAACANIIDLVESKFWWKGRMDSAKETLLILKTKKDNFVKIEKAINRLHSYEVPEIIALPIAAGNKNYLKWISDNAV